MERVEWISEEDGVLLGIKRKKNDRFNIPEDLA